MRLIRIAICMSIKKLSKSNWELTVCHDIPHWEHKSISHEGTRWTPRTQVLFIFLLKKLVISSITRGDITWQESSQCVTESSPSVQTCRLSVARDVQGSVASRSRHKSTQQSRAIYPNNLYNQPSETSSLTLTITYAG